MHQRRHLPPRPGRRVQVFLLAALALVCAAPLGAQTPLPDSSKVKRIFGVGDDEFFKGGWVKLRPGDTGMPLRPVGSFETTFATDAGQIWDVADKLGINILRVQAEALDLHMTDSLLSQRTRIDQRLIVTHHGADFNKISVGREVRFYPFTGRDSTEYKRWQAKFMTLAGGTTDSSAGELDVYGQPALEQHYRQDSMSGPMVIASDIVFDQFPARIYRWPDDSLVHFPGKVQNTEEFLADRYHFNSAASHQFVVVTGHLFDMPGTTLPGDSILEIRVIYEIPPKHTFMVYDPESGSASPQTSRVKIERDLATLLVRKRDLYPSGNQPDFDTYVEAALSFDARWCADSSFGFRNTGPLFPGNQSRRINLQLTWIGNEDVAIRSVALRDSIGQLVLGTSGPGIIGRENLFAEAIRDVRVGLSLDPNIPDSSRRGIIARSPHIESWPIHAAAFNRLTKLIADSVHAYDEINSVVDSIPVWNETDFNESLFQRWKATANPDLQVPDAVVPEIGIKTHSWLSADVKVSNGRIPSILEHNGGSFFIPGLELHPDSIEYAYESTLQLLGFHQYIPFRINHDIEHYRQMGVGRAAELARDLRRRLIVVPFCVADININYNLYPNPPGTAPRPERGVHSMVHIPEPSEMRTMMNLGLCYGAKGVLWQVIDGHYSIMDPANQASDDRGSFRFGSNLDFGVHTPHAQGPNLDRFAEFHFVESGGYRGYGDSSFAMIPDFFTGWNIRSNALTDIHRWIDQVGPHLMKLDWRDGYSMHFTVPQPYDTTIPHRPLPGNEIVSSVRSRYPGAAQPDSMHRTFVELGLFYTKNTTGDPLKDTNHIFLVNRRCFERTEDISDTSARGRLMDTLAETRTIDVRLNMLRPIDTSTVYGRYTYVRVQEIAADTTRLPLAMSSRRGLDTVVHPDSLFSITLGPGRAALLRFTYAPPDTSNINGLLEYSNQRKLGMRQIPSAKPLSVHSSQRIHFGPFLTFLYVCPVRGRLLPGYQQII